jgi:hypothetical protein
MLDGKARATRIRILAVMTAGLAAYAVTCFVPLDAAQAPAAACRVTGRATSNGKPLPGVSVVASSRNAGSAAASIATSSDTDGTYRLSLPPGTFTLTVQLTGFVPVERDITVSAPPCDQTLDLTLGLAPRDRPLAAVQPAAGRGSAAPATPAAAPPPATNASAASAGNAARPAGRSNAPAASARFQRLEVQSAGNDSQIADVAASPERDTADAATRLMLPPGFSTDAPTEAVAINGNAASIDRGLMNDRFAALGRGEFDPLTGEIAPGFGQQAGPGRGGPPGVGGGRGGPGGRGGAGGFFIGGRGGRQNTFNATMNYSFGGSVLDSAPYQLHPNSPTPKQPYSKQNFGVTIGGPVKIPHVYDGSRRTFFIASYTGNRGDNLFDQFATVPSAALRSGDFSGTSAVVVDPVTGLPFPGNQIPASRISPAAATLLQFIPLPNTDGVRNNFHYTTTTGSSLDNLNLRVIESFTPQPQNGRGGFGGRGGGARGGGRFGGGGGRAQGTNVVLTAQMQYRRTHADQANVFPTLGGENAGWNLGVPITLNVQHKRSLHNVNVNFSETHSAASNQYAFVRNIAGDAGIGGVSTDPFDWGLPSLSFANFSSARDLAPSTRTDRRISTAYRWTHPVKKHTLRAGGDFRFDRSTSEVDSNPRGSFVFTGLYAGGGLSGSTGTDLDFADFLLGLPQQASVQYGPGKVSVDGRSMSLFMQDDWRKSAGLTFSLGLRYELLWPFTETHGEMVNLDVAPDFSAAVPVVSGGMGPFTGSFPRGLIQTDTNNLAPRLGVAWRIKPGMILRGGYGISYNSGTYSTIARQMVGQPPFAVTDTTIGSLVSPLSILDPFAGVSPNATTNNYGVARNYDLGRVQTWNADFAKDLSPIWNVSAGYTEIRGANLDIVRAPNRGPSGLRIADVQPFLWQTSEGASVLHAGTFRLQRRQSHGIGGNLTYTLGRSRDDASTVGGGATVVAQNDQDLAAEWGRSSFDRRQQISGAISIELPFGPNRRWLNGGGLWATLLDNWRLSGNYSWQSGTPLTPLVRASAADAARGTSGTLRADYDGASISIPNPTIAEFFNTGAFSVPFPGAFGTAGRNIITGPGSHQLNAQLARDLRYGRTRTLTLDVSATNLLNTVNFGAIDTFVNSPTFGQVLSVRPRRSVQVGLRFRF